MTEPQKPAFNSDRAYRGVEVEHRIRHFVYGVAGDRSTLIPREAGMRGAWPCEAKCSCGWETNTGGAVRSFIAAEVAEHKFDVEHGFWSPTTPREEA